MHRKLRHETLSTATKSRLIAAIVLLAIAPAADAADWPRWRGPNDSGAVAEGPTPVEFSKPEDFAWRIDLPGQGASTPAVYGDLLALTCTVDGQDTVCCYGLDGQPRWQKSLGPERPAKHRDGSSAAPSPATDGQRIVVYYKSGTIAALDWNGGILWQKNIQQEYGEDTLWWDLGTSPVLADGKVIVAVMHTGESFLAALDANTGEEIWKTARVYECPRECDQAYTTPSVVDVDGRMTIVTWGADHLTGHDLQTGALLWECDGFNPNAEGAWRVIASAAVGEGWAVVPYGRGEFVAGVRLGGSGDVTASNRLWQREGIGADVPTPAIAGGKTYVLGDQGALTCLDLQTGETVWETTLPRSRNKFYSSPLLVGDILYCTRIDGTVFVGHVTATGYELLATNELDDRITATAVPVEAGILFRGSERLVLAAGKK